MDHGNASSSAGASIINIKNYGDFQNPQRNISIQRANLVTLDNSAIVLSGATDRTNEYANEYFTLSRIDELKLKNSSAIYLNYGANLLRKLSSLVDVEENSIITEEIATVDIDPITGEFTRNVDNRVYLLEGKILNIATNENVTAYGDVEGMMFLGIYTSRVNPAASTAFYDYTFKNGDPIINTGTFSSDGKVLGRHKEDHDIEVDGFYTNYDEEGTIKVGYVGVTPEDDIYYIWIVGDATDIVFEFNLTASKYSTLGTYELVLTGLGDPNTKFNVIEFSSGLESDVSLVNSKTIPDIASTTNEANTIFGLGMRTGKTNWQNNAYTEFYSADNGSYSGDTLYDSDNSTFAPSLLFYFYHSANLTDVRELGVAKIRLMARIPEGPLSFRVVYIDINITLLTALYQDYYYEAAITAGEEYDFFMTTETNITDKSVFSTYYSLFIADFSQSPYEQDYYDYKHVIVSTDFENYPYAFKEGTKITMLDMVTNTTYYYIVTALDESSGKYVYELKDFIKMGTTNEFYDDTAANNIYYRTSQDLVHEKFIFHVTFVDVGLGANIIDHKLLMEMRTNVGGYVLGVLAIQRDSTKYSVYVGRDASIDVEEVLDSNILYLGTELDVGLITIFKQDIVDSKTIFDTRYFDKKMGINISIYDGDNNRLTGDDLLGVSFIIDGIRYYPRADGTTRIKIADRLSNIYSNMVVDAGNNSSIPTGAYMLKVEAFGSPDGIYYGTEPPCSDEQEIIIINRKYGLKVITDDNSKIIDKVTGETENENNRKLLDVTVLYNAGLENPIITVSLERRRYNSIYDRIYEQVDLANYVTNVLIPTDEPLEYEFTDTPLVYEEILEEFNTLILELDENLMTGTYRLVFKLYEGAFYIGDAYEQFIIK